MRNLFDNLNSGLILYKENKYYGLTLRLEEEGSFIVDNFKKLHSLNESEIFQLKERCFNFINYVYCWKTSNPLIIKTNNDTESIWRSLLQAIESKSDEEKLLAIMSLSGFGAAIHKQTGQQRAKMATAALRFLWPEEWGVVDWRVAGIISILHNKKWDFHKLKTHNNYFFYKNAFEIMDEMDAIKYNKIYRHISKESRGMFRSADVDMALFGWSTKLWAMGN